MSKIKLPGQDRSKNKISISINGPARGGKTTVARAIEFLLKNAGFEVSMHDDNESFPPLTECVRRIADKTSVAIHTQSQPSRNLRTFGYAEQHYDGPPSPLVPVQDGSWITTSTQSVDHHGVSGLEGQPISDSELIEIAHSPSNTTVALAQPVPLAPVATVYAGGGPAIPYPTYVDSLDIEYSQYMEDDTTEVL